MSEGPPQRPRCPACRVPRQKAAPCRKPCHPYRKYSHRNNEASRNSVRGNSADNPQRRRGHRHNARCSPRWPHHRQSLRPHRPPSHQRSGRIPSRPLLQGKPNPVRLLARPNQRHRNPRQCPRRSRVVRSPSLPRSRRMTRRRTATNRDAKWKTASSRGGPFPPNGAGKRQGAGAYALAPDHFGVPIRRSEVRNRFRCPAEMGAFQGSIRSAKPAAYVCWRTDACRSEGENALLLDRLRGCLDHAMADRFSRAVTSAEHRCTGWKPWEMPQSRQ